MTNIYTGSVLAGACKGKNVNSAALLDHAVASEELVAGRLRRAAGEALCSRALNMVDVYGGVEGVAGVTCPKCLEILARM